MTDHHLSVIVALEHEAVWLYGLIGGRFSELNAPAEASWRAHRAQRDALLARVDDPGPSVAYAEPPTDAAAARLRAQDVEARLSAAWLTAVADTADDQRRAVVEELTRAELARISWGGTPLPFPGT